MCRNEIQQRNVVDDLQHAADDERQRRKRRRQQRARQCRADRRCQAARNRGHARGRRSLGRRDHRHDVGGARRHVHLRQRRAHEQQAEHDREIGRERRENETDARWNVGEDHRVDEAEAPAEPRRHRIRESGENVRPEKERARGGKREVEAFEQPEREQRLNGKAARKRIQAEQCGELVDGPARWAQAPWLAAPPPAPWRGEAAHRTRLPPGRARHRRRTWPAARRPCPFRGRPASPARRRRARRPRWTARRPGCSARIHASGPCPTRLARATPARAGYVSPMSPVVGFMVPTKAIAAMKTRCWTLRDRDPGEDHQHRAGQKQRAHVVARRQVPDRQGRRGRAEKRSCCHDADLERIEPELQQIGRQDDGGEPVAESARRARRVQVEDVRPPAGAQACEHARATTEVRQRRHRSVGRRHGEVVEIHMAVGLGPQADASGDRLGQDVLQVELAVEIAGDLGPLDREP